MKKLGSRLQGGGGGDDDPSPERAERDSEGSLQRPEKH